MKFCTFQSLYITGCVCIIYTHGVIILGTAVYNIHYVYYTHALCIIRRMLEARP